MFKVKNKNTRTTSFQNFAIAILLLDFFLLTHFWLMFPFYFWPMFPKPPFLVFSGGIKWEHWPEMG